MASSSSDQAASTADTASFSKDNASTTQPAAPSAAAGQVPQEPYKVSKVRFVLIFISLQLGLLLFALDQLIVATAIPKITNQFHSLTKISWIADGFFLTLLSFTLMWAQWVTIFPSKHVILAAVSIFEIGSLVCGVAPSMNVLILGRALAGVGGAGIFQASLMIITEITTMAQRAKLFAFFGVSFAVASILGPVLGGALTDALSWRWCFYINLPVGGVAFGFLILLVPHLPPYGRADTYKGYGRHTLAQLARCDWMGLAFVIGWGVVSVLVMEQGGITKSWTSASVIVMFVMIPVIAAMFIAWEYWMGEKAMLPLFVFKNKILVCCILLSLFVQGAFIEIVQYLSEGYQAVYHASATKAGIYLLPCIIVNLVVLIFSGRYVAATGRPFPLLVGGPSLIAVGCGLLYSIKSTDSKSFAMGYSAILGFGIGMCIQNTAIIAQYQYHKEPKRISIATGAVQFFGFIGRMYGIGLGGSVFENMIVVNLHKYAPSLSSDLVKQVQDNADAVWDVVPDDQRPVVLKAYVKTLSAVYLIGVPMSIIALGAALVIGNIHMDLKKKKPASDPDATKSDPEANAAGASQTTSAVESHFDGKGTLPMSTASPMTEALEAPAKEGDIEMEALSLPERNTPNAGKP